MELAQGMANRWAGGSLEMPWHGDGSTVSVSCGDVTETATVAQGVATLTAAQTVQLMPALGVYVLDFGGVPVDVESVSVRYCTRADIVAYGERNGDDFGNQQRYPEAAFDAAIQAAEEAIEAGTRRSFCKRAATVPITAGALIELPFEDAVSTTEGELRNGRQICSAISGEATVVYGAPLDRQIRNAAVQLAASIMRPRATAENVRGSSMDGVYVSYTLATGEDGSWTGLPDVDAVIASHRSHRAVVM